MTNVLIDGEVFCLQNGGGVSRIFEEVIPRMVQDYPSLAMTLFLRDKAINRRVLSLGIQTKNVWHPRRNARGYRLRNLICEVIDRWVVPLIKRSVRYDVFLSTYFNLPPRPNIPSIVFVYDMVYEYFPELFDSDHHASVVAQKRAAIEQASLVLCISEATRNAVIELIGIPKERCRVVYLSGERFSSLNPVAKPYVGDAIRLIYVGQYNTPYKNFEFMLRALASASKPEIRNAELRVVCRNRPTADDLNRYREIWPEGKLVFESDCSDQQLAEYYVSSSALVYPSLYEGFGLPLVEAHSLGVPVVCSDIPVFRELGDGSYFMFDPSSPVDFELALCNALSFRRAPGMVARLRQHAAQFTWQRTTEGVVEAIKEVMA